MKPEELLDELHIKLANVIYPNKWGLIQRSANADPIRTFLLWEHNKRLVVHLTSEIDGEPITTIVNGVGFSTINGGLSEEQIAEVLRKAFAQLK